jgi:hypothetical protein
MAGPPPAGTAVALAEARVAREIAAQQAKCEEWERRAAAGLKPGKGGRPVPPELYCRVRQAQDKLAAARVREEKAASKAAARQERAAVIVRNITDPDSRLMLTRDGKQQCYNGQQVTSRDLLVIATELTDDPTDMAWFEPMMAQAEEAAALILAHQPPAPAAPAPAGGDTGDPPPGTASGIGQALADAGYLSRHNLTCPGPDRLIATGKRRDLEQAARDSTAASPGGADGGPDDDADDDVITAMAARLATGDGIAAYRQRGHIAETPHGDIKHNMGFRQLSLRGKRKAAAEWKFACAVRNLRTAISSGHLTLQALADLAPRGT